MKRMQPKFRLGLVIGTEELKEKKTDDRDLMAELLMEPGYIGYIDIAEEKMRVYVFSNKQSREKILRIAKSFGFRTAGSIKDVVYISNEILKRPHLKYASKDNFYKELYR